MEKISSGEEVGGAGGAYSYSALKRLDQIWASICEPQAGMSQIVKTLYREVDPDLLLLILALLRLAITFDTLIHICFRVLVASSVIHQTQCHRKVQFGSSYENYSVR